MKSRNLFLVALLAIALVVSGMACNTPSTTLPSSTQTTSSTTATSATTTTSSSTTSSNSGGTQVLTKSALALEGANHLAASATMCMFCHMPGAGVNQYPMAPSWNGSDKTPGTWTITAGSDADHTNRSDSASCVVAGCHTASWAQVAPPPQPPATSAPPTSSGPASGKVQVTMTMTGFLPPSITITCGSTIVWHSDEHEDLEIESEIFSGIVPAGGNFEFLFLETGTFTYFNVENPSAKGTVTVV